MIFDVFVTDKNEKRKHATAVVRQDAGPVSRIPRLTHWPKPMKITPVAVDNHHQNASSIIPRLFAVPATIQTLNEHLHESLIGAASSTTAEHRRNEYDLHQRSYPFNSWRPVGKLTINNDIPSKAWKTVRFSNKCSRASNTNRMICINKSVQTVVNVDHFRLNTWPTWNPKASHANRKTWCSLLTRRVLSFFLSQFGIALFLSIWIALNAALFHYFESSHDRKLLNDIATKKNELVISLATELRQVSPYQMAWRKKIDDYFSHFENALINATLKGYINHKSTLTTPMTYSDSVVFCLQLITGLGYGAQVPKSYWSELLTLPCVIIGLPFTWLLLLDFSAKCADNLSQLIRWLRSNLAKRYPDVISLNVNQETPLASQSGAAISIINNGEPIGNGDATAENSDTTKLSNQTNLFTPSATSSSSSQASSSKLKALAEQANHRATQWTSTLVTLVYPFFGSIIFGTWADLSVASSVAWPMISLLLISPTPVLHTISWRIWFHVYLIIGWVLTGSCLLLWYPSWRSIFKKCARKFKRVVVELN